MYKLTILPEGSIIPEDIRALVVQEPDLLRRLTAGESADALITVSTRELQLLVEYADLLDIEVRAIIGVQGAMYSTVWNTYVATMERISLDAYRLERKELRDNASESGRRSVIAPSRGDRLRSVKDSGRDAADPDQPLDADDFAG